MYNKPTYNLEVPYLMDPAVPSQEVWLVYDLGGK